jgi:hypothetical protein
MTMLENKAPSYSFKDRDTVRNRYNRSNIPRRLKTAMALQMQEYEREAAGCQIDKAMA